MLLVQPLAIYYLVKATDWLTLSTSRWFRVVLFLSFSLCVANWMLRVQQHVLTLAFWTIHFCPVLWYALTQRLHFSHFFIYSQLTVVSCLISSKLQSSFPFLLRETLYPGLGLHHLPRQWSVCLPAENGDSCRTVSWVFLLKSSNCNWQSRSLVPITPGQLQQNSITTHWWFFCSNDFVNESLLFKQFLAVQRLMMLTAYMHITHTDLFVLPFSALPDPELSNWVICFAKIHLCLCPFPFIASYTYAAIAQFHRIVFCLYFMEETRLGNCLS